MWTPRSKVGQGTAAAAFSCDVTSEQSVIDAISAVSAQFGRIDVLVNSAGVGVMGPAEDLAVDSWDLTMAVNLRGAFLVSQQVGRIMLARGSGTVIGMASQAATVALPGHRLLRIQVRPGGPPRCLLWNGLAEGLRPTPSVPQW